MAWTSLFTPQHGAASARRRVGALLAGCAALALLAGCATAPREPVTVRVIAFNDFHGNLESGSLSLPWPDPDQPGRAKRLNAGGAAFLANTVQALRQGVAPGRRVAHVPARAIVTTPFFPRGLIP